MWVAARVMRGCTRLRELGLGRNGLGDAGAGSVAAVLPLCAELRALDLTEARVGHAALAMLTEVLPRCKGLESVRLCNGLSGRRLQDDEEEQERQLEVLSFFIRGGGGWIEVGDDDDQAEVNRKLCRLKVAGAHPAAVRTARRCRGWQRTSLQERDTGRGRRGKEEWGRRGVEKNKCYVSSSWLLLVVHAIPQRCLASIVRLIHNRCEKNSSVNR